MSPGSLPYISLHCISIQYFLKASLRIRFGARGFFGLIVLADPAILYFTTVPHCCPVKVPDDYYKV